jgi:hypothetical protein
MLQQVWKWLLGLFAVSLTVFFVLAVQRPEQGTLGFEAAKSLLQVTVVSVSGAVISLVTFEYQRRRQLADKEVEHDRAKREQKRDIKRARVEKKRDRGVIQQEYRDDLLKALLARLMDNYTAVKKARRILRGRGLAPGGEPPEVHVLASVYDAQFDALNEAQLAFEHIRRDVVTSSAAFGPANYTPLVDALGKLDKYLGGLVTEFEDRRRSFAGDPAVCRLSNLPELAKLLGSGQTPFQQEFVHAYHRAQGLLRGELLHPKLPVPDVPDAPESAG